MTDHTAAFHTALIAKLQAASGLTALLTDGASGVYDHVPQGSSFPYVSVGEYATQEDGAKGLNGQDFDVTIHTWSRYRGRKEIFDIMKQIYAALHEQSLTVSGGDTILLRYAFSDDFPDPDGITQHGVQRFRALVHDS